MDRLKKCVEFHGHECGGLTIGYKAVLYAEKLLKLPEKARIFLSVPCDCCGEVTAEPYMHMENGKKICGDCYQTYSRFDI